MDLFSKIRTRLTHWGEYAIDQLKVRVLSDREAEITCEQYIVNSPKTRWSVRVGWLERRRGVTLESKVMQKKREVIAWMEEQNKKIRARREMEKRLNEGMHVDCEPKKNVGSQAHEVNGRTRTY